MKKAQKIIDFIQYAEGLKTELRHATKSDRARESVADHTWRLTLMLMLVMPNLKLKIDQLKALKMAIIHDIVEIDAKDLPILEHIDNKEMSIKKEALENKAIKAIKKQLGESSTDISTLWQEFEQGKTNEAKVVHALDKLEGQLQFLKDPVRKFTLAEQKSITFLLDQTSELCQIDPFLVELDQLTIKDRKIRIKPD